MRLRLAIIVFVAIAVSRNLWCRPQGDGGPQRVGEQVWKIVDQKFLDPSFNHHDPRQIRDQLVAVANAGTSQTYAAIRTTLALLGDTQTRLLEPAQLASTIQEFEGAAGGIGVTEPWIVTAPNSGELKILHVTADSPAFKMGLRPGDVIEGIDGTPTKGLVLDEALMRIRGKVDSTVEVTILRWHRRFQVTLTRKALALHTVHTILANKNGRTLGYLALTEFSTSSAQEMHDALSDLLSRNAQGFVLDLRNNPGGFVPASRDIANLFLGKQQRIYRSVDRTGIPKDTLSEGSPVTVKPVVVIMNRATASAAEMLAGALHDNHRAMLVGTRTFGQGLIHSLQPLSDGSGLIVAVARFETPNRMEIHHRGILPDYQVEGKEMDLGRQKADPQYEMAVKVLLEKIARMKES